MAEPITNLRDLNTPVKIAAAGERIYEQRYKKDFERDHRGEFVAIDVVTGLAHVDPLPEEAIRKAREALPYAVIHLIRVGAPGAFKVSYTTARHDDWWTLRSVG